MPASLSARRRFGSLFLAIALLLLQMAPAMATEITTDLWVYNYGDTVTVTGVDYAPLETVEIVTTDPYGVEVDRGQATADESGGFTYQFVLLSDVPGIYDVVANGLASGLTASTQFDPTNVSISNAAFSWQNGAFTLSLSGTYSCSTGGAACTDPDDVTIEVFASDGINDSVAGSALEAKVVPVSTLGNNRPWSTTFAFPGDFSSTPQGKYDIRATFHGTNGGTPVSAEAFADDRFGFDDVAPTSVLNPFTAPAPGVALTFSGTATDATSGVDNPGIDLVLRRTSAPPGVVASDTRPVTGAAGAWSWTFLSGLPEATYCLDRSAFDNADNHELIASYCFAIVGADTDPTGTADNDPVVVNEGDLAANTGTYVDADSDPVALTASVGTVNGTGSGTWGWSFQTTDGPDETQTVTIYGNDGSGAVAIASFQLTVQNVTPTGTADNATVTVDEGDTATNDGTYSDPGNDPITLAANVGTVIDNNDGTWSWSFGTSDGPDDSQTVSITGDDGDGAGPFQIASFGLAVNNVTPTGSADTATVTVDEGDTANNTGTYFDPGDDPITLTSSIGAMVDNGDGTWSWSFTTADGPPDSQTVNIFGDDGDGAGPVQIASFALVVENVEPEIQNLIVTPPSGAACQGGTNIVSVSFTISDPADNGHDPITGTIDWGDGDSDPLSGRTFSLTHSYAAGAYTITINVNDGDAGTDSELASFSVVYDLSGFLPPLNNDGSSVFKHGSTVPVKIQVLDCNGNPVLELTDVHIGWSLSSPATPGSGINETQSTSAADTTGLMRNVDSQYLYNFATRYLPDPNATYYFYVYGPQIETASVRFATRSK